MFNSYIYLDIKIPEISFIGLICAIAWLAIFLGVLIFSYIFANVMPKSQKRKFEKSRYDFNVRIYNYDYAKQTFYYFDSVNIRNTASLSKEQFLSQFSRADRYLVDDWLRAIANNEKYSEYIQADVIINRANKYVSSILELTNANRAQNIIHFNSHILPNITANNKKILSKSKSRISQKYLITTPDLADNFMLNGSIENIGAVYYFKLYFKESEAGDSEDTNQSIKLNEQLLLVLSKFLSKDKKLVKLGKFDEIIIDNTCISKINAMNTASTIQTHLQKYLNQNGELDYRVAVGVSTGNYYKHNFALASEQSMKMADAIINGLSTDKVLFYDESFFKNYQQNRAFKDEVKMVIQNSTYRTYFTPTLDISIGKQSFYILDVVPFGTEIKDLYSVINMAEDVKGGAMILFSSIIRKINTICKSKNITNTFAIKIPFNSIETFITANQAIAPKNIHWIICIDEVDLLNSLSDSTTIAKNIHEYSKIGYRIALIIKNPTSNLRSRILRKISYFFIPPKFTSEATDLNRARTDLRNIQSGYEQYKVPLVYYGLKDIEDIELGVHYSGKIFQCDEVKLPSSHIESIDLTEIDEIMLDTQKLAPKYSIKGIFENSNEVIDINK